MSQRVFGVVSLRAVLRDGDGVHGLMLDGVVEETAFNGADVGLLKFGDTRLSSRAATWSRCAA